jgi:hypothetical protein
VPHARLAREDTNKVGQPALASASDRNAAAAEPPERPRRAAAGRSNLERDAGRRQIGEGCRAVFSGRQARLTARTDHSVA